ncbi:GMC family oxidoreductase [Candidatus Spongiihabitans sp.]|uniref:GMC family oxidoreductase n=1 Tax=Candidatus Spongiihabitans sp. TaxID=3101308 RepID=UPI003C7B3EBB
MIRHQAAFEYFPEAAKISARHFDVVIVGAGVAGALLAYELVSAGKRVLMLEAGPDKTSLQDRSHYVQNYKKASLRVPECAYPQVDAAPRPATDDLFVRPYKGYLEQTGSRRSHIPPAVSDDWFKSTYERRVGGTTWHWLGSCLRFVPNDFRMRSTYHPPPLGFVDWPISYDDLAPWYDKAATELGVSGDDRYVFGIPRNHRACPPAYKSLPPHHYPMPAIAQSYSDQQVMKQAQGMAVDVDGLQVPLLISPTPQARNATPGYQNRPQCSGNNSCIPVCPIQAKYDATVHINMCREQYGDLFTLQAQACALKVTVDNQAQVSGIAFRQWQQDGADIAYHDYSASADIFVVAAHAIETPKLLLNSASEHAPNGVANTSGLVGKYLMDHNIQLSYALVKDPIYAYRGPLSTSGIENLKDAPTRSGMAAFRIELGNDGWAWPANAPYGTAYHLIQGERGVFGAALQERLEKTLTRQLRVAALVEATPIKEHSVTLSDEVDALGIPRPKVRYGISDDPYCRRGMNAAIQVHHQIFRALGALPEDIHHKPVNEFAGAGHIMGTYRMGDQPEASVVDKYQRSHDHKNLFLIGSGVFPTGGASNPTFTIAALALWAAQTIRQQLAAR